MKKLAMIAALSGAMCAGAVELSWGSPLPVDRSGYPLMTNDPEKAVLMLQSRVSRLEAWAVSNMLERAEADRRREEARKEREARAKADAEHARVNAEFRKWLDDQRRKYGSMVLVGYDTNTCERIYRRIDGTTARKRCYDDALDRPRVRARGRAAK